MSYWTDREEAARRAYQLEGDAYINAINEIYDSMLSEIQKEINNFYAKYATSEGITMSEAQKRVSELDIEEYERKAKKYVETQDFSDQANKEMRLYNLTMKVNRLEMLKSNIGLEMVDGFNSIEQAVKDGLIRRATSEYARQAGILGKTVQNNAQSARNLVNASYHHATWSDRIWMYQDELKAELDKLLRSGIIQGRSPLDLAQELLKQFNASKYEADRLMRTELARVQIGAEVDSLIANGFEYYQFNALGTACPECLALDEQHFKIADLMPGTNAPPMHPNCMCSISAWMDDELYNEWLESYANHGLSFEDWFNNMATNYDGLFEGHTFNEMLTNYNYHNARTGRINRAQWEKAQAEWEKMKSPNVSDKDRDLIENSGHQYTKSSYNSNRINEAMRNHVGEDLNQYLTDGDLETAEALRKAIANNTMPCDATVTRYISGDAASHFGISDEFTKLIQSGRVSSSEIQSTLEPLVGNVIKENQFVSASGNKVFNEFDNLTFRLDMEVLKGTNAYISGNSAEAEVIFDSPSYQIVGFEKINRDYGVDGVAFKVRVLP